MSSSDYFAQPEPHHYRFTIIDGQPRLTLHHNDDGRYLLRAFLIQTPCDWAQYRKELIQVAAVCVAAISNIPNQKQ